MFACSYVVARFAPFIVGTMPQGEIRCFRNSKKLRKPDVLKLRCVSARRFRRETCKIKMEGSFRVFAALPSVDLNVSVCFHCVSASGLVSKFAGFQFLVSRKIKLILTVLSMPFKMRNHCMDLLYSK